MKFAVQSANEIAETFRHGVIVKTKLESDKTVCHLSDGGSFFVSNFLGSYIRPGDEIAFPLDVESPGARTEICIRKTSSAQGNRDLYQAAISYAAQPKADKRGRLYVRAEVSAGHLGFSSIRLPCDVVRDYFYVATRGAPWDRQTSLYEVLRTAPTASSAELRLAFKLRQLELSAAGVSKHDRGTPERAFNILAQPELRSCYDSLLKDSSAPALFPYGGFGSILVAGNRSRDGLTFFPTQILSFAPRTSGAPVPRASAQF